MKKLLLSFTLLLSFFTYSQNSKIKFGFQGGVNYSNFRGYNIPVSFGQFYSESPAFAYLLGVNFEYKIQEKLSLRLELNYERKSQTADNIIELTQNFDDPAQTYNFTTRKNYDYLVLPVLLKYSFSNKNSFYVNGGPFIGYLLKSKITDDLEVPGVNTDGFDTTKDNKKTDFGLSLGLGKNFDLGARKTISIEIRENLGLANTSKTNVWGGGNVKTNSINFIVGLSFN